MKKRAQQNSWGFSPWCSWVCVNQKWIKDTSLAIKAQGLHQDRHITPKLNLTSLI